MRPLTKSMRIEGWAKRLGLAQTTLHQKVDHNIGEPRSEEHVALLDGVDGSLAVSTVPVEQSTGLNWAWSSLLRAHVDVGDEKVIVHPVGERGKVLRFELLQVQENLEKFYGIVTEHAARPAVTVVEHIASCFRSHRAVVEHDGADAEDSLKSFLAILENAVRENETKKDGLAADHQARVLEELRYNSLIGRETDLRLTIRHAGGMVFQETHAELDSEPLAPQLFGLAPSPRKSTRNRLGAYYTPPGLARTLSDLAIKPHLSQPSITIFDPACGSGIFLVEALRTLERCAYLGKIRLVGFDISSIAIRMAEFSLRNAGTFLNVDYKVECRDFLHFDGNVAADIVIMNPPFVAYENLTADLKAAIRAKLGEAYRFKPDFSMLFLSLALEQIAQGGTAASLLPAGVLQQTSASNWRSSIVEGKALELVAVLGDHGLFRDALVNISALILRDVPSEDPLRPTMFWASQQRGAGAEGLRHLRRWADGDKRPPRSSEWSIYQARKGLISPRGNWTPRPNSLGNLPEVFHQKIGMSTVGALFHVEQGIRPGEIGELATVTIDEWESLPAKEQKYFRPVAENKSIRNGTIIPLHMMFFPSTPLTRGEVRKQLPVFFETRIATSALENDELVEATRARRGTNDQRLKRIVSRVYVAQDSFAVDKTGDFVAVQANAWIAKPSLVRHPGDLSDLLTDYALLMNSRFFFMLLREYCRIVGGGQVEASQTSTGPVPLPDLPTVYSRFPNIAAQADKLRAKNEIAYPKPAELNEFAALLYQTNSEEWVSVQ